MDHGSIRMGWEVLFWECEMSPGVRMEGIWDDKGDDEMRQGEARVRVGG